MTAKLIRDRIPDLIRAQGVEPIVVSAGENDLFGLLIAKLCEEVDEFCAHGDVDELADVLCVVYALAEQRGITVVELADLEARKATERGRFTQRLVWFGNRAGAA